MDKKYECCGNDALLYKDEFLKFGFTDIIDCSGLVCAQNVYCLQVLLNKSIKVNTFQRHLNTIYPILVNKQIILERT